MSTKTRKSAAILPEVPSMKGTPPSDLKTAGSDDTQPTRGFMLVPDALEVLSDNLGSLERAMRSLQDRLGLVLANTGSLAYADSPAPDTPDSPLVVWIKALDARVQSLHEDVSDIHARLALP